MPKPSTDDPLHRLPWGRVTTTRRVLLSMSFVVGALVLVPATTPIGRLNRLAWDHAQPVLDITGTHQGWSLFAPRPSIWVTYLEFEVYHADGSIEHVRFPEQWPAEPHRRTRWKRLSMTLGWEQSEVYARRAAREVVADAAPGSVVRVDAVAVTYHSVLRVGEPPLPDEREVIFSFSSDELR